MGDSGLDLDINNYSIQDLEKFFRFQKNQTYTAIEIERRESLIREQLLSSGHIDKRFKRDLIEFLNTAKDWLIYTKCKPIKPPTLIPENYKLDKMNTPLSREPTSREENIIKRPESEFTYVNTSEYFKGSLNPLNTRIVTKCINVDTKFRDNFHRTNSSDFMISLPDKLSKVVSMQLSALEFPVCFFGISQSYGNNFFYIEIYTNDDTDGVIKKFIIPDGNYTAQDFLTALNTAVCPLNTDGTIKDPTSYFSYIHFTHNINSSGSGTGTVNVELNTATEYGTQYTKDIRSFTLDFMTDFNGDENEEPFDFLATRISWNIGFQRGKYKDKIKYTSETIIEPFAIRYVYLAIEDFNNSVNTLFMNSYSNRIINSNVLAKISIRSDYFNLLMDNDLNIVTEPRKYFGPVEIQRLRIRIYDEHGRILNMNNSNYSFCLIFKMLYDL